MIYMKGIEQKHIDAKFLLSPADTERGVKQHPVKLTLSRKSQGNSQTAWTVCKVHVKQVSWSFNSSKLPILFLFSLYLTIWYLLQQNHFLWQGRGCCCIPPATPPCLSICYLPVCADLRPWNHADTTLAKGPSDTTNPLRPSAGLIWVA